MKEHEKKELEKLESLRKTIEASPLTQQIIAEKAAATLATRQAAANEIEILRTERDEVIPKLQADLKTKEAKYLEAKTALDAATGEFQTARAALSSKSHVFDIAITNHEAILYETASFEINEAVAFFTEKLDFLRSPGRISRTAGGSVSNIFTMKRTTKEESNADAVKGVLSYCQAAIKELERMKLTPALDVEKIERIKAGVPSIDIYTEVTGERPLSRPPDPLAALPSDSEIDWKRDSLIEKAKKVLKR